MIYRHSFKTGNQIQVPITYSSITCCHHFNFLICFRFAPSSLDLFSILMMLFMLGGLGYSSKHFDDQNTWPGIVNGFFTNIRPV